MDGALAVESESVQLLRCDNGDIEIDCSEEKKPPDHAQFGGRVRGGYQWPRFAIEGGIGIYQGWLHYYDKTRILGGGVDYVDNGIRVC